jgi:hypothetical protein
MSKSSNSVEETSPDRLEYKGVKEEYWQAQGESERGELGEGTEAAAF